MLLNLSRAVTFLTCVCFASAASAQFAQPPGAPPGQLPPAPAIAPAAPAAPPKPVSETTISDRREGSNDQKDWHFIGHVEMDQGGDSKIYADDVWAYTGQDKAIATGNVVFAQGNNRISAERAEFNTQTRLGTFHNAWGMTTVKPQAQMPRPGQVTAPTMTGQENIIYFFGETIEKIGPKKYKITNGGFSTCVQPTPRWDLHAGTVILNVDHYTLMTNAVLAVKGVPMMYLPVLYYPTKREDRATGFLIPTYGASSYRGQSIHNAFFWAINRSQDATITHDWFSKTGQGVGTEYRYNMGPGSDGNFRASMLDEVLPTVAGDTDPTSQRSYDIRGNLNQTLPWNLRAQANVNYFSSIVSSQSYNVNIQDTSRNNRSYGGNIAGAWRNYTLNATMLHSEYFFDANNSNVSGTWPRVSFSRNERPIGNSQAYFSLSSEYAKQLREQRLVTVDAGTGLSSAREDDTGLSRFDISPQIRYPFKKWQWFTVNSTLSWRDTYYSRSYEPSDDPAVRPTEVIDVGLNRPLFTFQSQIVGPVFNRVWDTPGNGYAEKFKHSIEPVLTVDRTSSVDNFDQIIQFDGTDNFVGGTRLTYGLNNRFYAKRSLVPGQPAQSREIFDVEVSQSYYTNQLQSQHDSQYQTGTFGTSLQPPSSFSALVLSVRAMPTNELNANVRAEFDARTRALSTISAQGSYAWAQFGQATLAWSKTVSQQFGIPGTEPFVDQSVNGSTNLHTKDNRYGGQYSFNYNVRQGLLLQQQITGFYNAQCCGLAFQYQTYNYGPSSFFQVSEDRRFFLSFTLAGLGNFSPFNGAMNGVPR